MAKKPIFEGKTVEIKNQSQNKLLQIKDRLIFRAFASHQEWFNYDKISDKLISSRFASR